MSLNELTQGIIGAAIEVHRALGPGLLESAYEACLAWELEQSGLAVRRQVLLPVTYKEAVLIDAAYRIDLIVEERLVVELKTVEKVLPLHEAQLLTYLRLSGIKTGLLINFLSPTIRAGLKRMVV